MYTGKQILMETLLAEGVDVIVGNPGTTELPLIDSLLDYPQIKYILTLQEAVAVTIADAYAQASGKVGVANLHVGPGLGNGLGSLYNAWEGQTPLLLTAGQQDNRMRLREPLLGHDLVAMAAPLTKWSVQAETADELPHVLNRAFKTARETPSGPVFVSLPFNVMEQTTEHPPMSPSSLYHRSVPDPAGIAQAAEMLLAARNPAIVCGDKVARSGAVAILVKLAELIGAGVNAVTLPSHVSFPNQHSNFRGRGAFDQALIRKRLDGADAVLMVGGEFFEEVWYVDTPPFPQGAKLIQIDPSSANIGRNYSVHCGLLGDPKLALEALYAQLERGMDDDDRTAAERRNQALAASKASERAEQQARIERDGGNRPMSSARLMAEIHAGIPENTSIAGEAITATADVLNTFSFERPLDFLASRGGGIGQGLPSAIGIKLAHPDRPVLCLSGDGSALYTVQALWTAAHHHIPVVFVIINNRVYRILKLNMNRYRHDAELPADRGYPHLDLTEPEVDFVRIAEGLGVKARRIEQAEEVASAVRTAFESGEPYLLDIAVDGSV